MLSKGGLNIKVISNTPSPKALIDFKRKLHELYRKQIKAKPP